MPLLASASDPRVAWRSADGRVEYLGMLTAIGINKKAYKPTKEEIKVKYYAKFRGKNHQEEQELAMVEGVMSPCKPPRAAGSPPSRKSPRLSK